MKEILFVAFLIGSLSAKSVYWKSHYDTSHHEAVRLSKNIMVFLILKDAPQNRKILRYTFMNQDYIDIINKNYISVIVTKNQKTSYPIEALFTVEYPAVFFLDKNNLFLCDPLFGNITPDRLRAHLVECN